MTNWLFLILSTAENPFLPSFFFLVLIIPYDRDLLISSITIFKSLGEKKKLIWIQLICILFKTQYFEIKKEDFKYQLMSALQKKLSATILFCIKKFLEFINKVFHSKQLFENYPIWKKKTLSSLKYFKEGIDTLCLNSGVSWVVSIQLFWLTLKRSFPFH